MDQRHQISVSRVLRILGVSTSGFYDYIKREPSKQALRKKEIKTQIQIKYDESKQIYGAPKITVKLKDTGVKIAVKTVSNYMRELDIRAIYRSKWIKTTVDSDFSTNLENLVKREFDTDKPNSVWVTDITYSWTYTGFVYLTSVMDSNMSPSYSKKADPWDNVCIESFHAIIKREWLKRFKIKD